MRSEPAMTDKPEARLRPLQDEGCGGGGRLSSARSQKSRFPTIRSPTSISTSRRCRRLVDDGAPRPSWPRTGGEVVGWAYVSKRQKFITKETYADFHCIFVAPRSAAPARSASWCDAVFDYCRQREARQRRVPDPRDQRADEGRAGAGRLRADADLLREALWMIPRERLTPGLWRPLRLVRPVRNAPRDALADDLAGRAQPLHDLVDGDIGIHLGIAQQRVDQQ